MKKASYILAALMIMSSLSIVSFAETPESQDATVTVTGKVEPKKSDSGGGDSGSGSISVVVPTKATFIIDENRSFISPDYVITNNSEGLSVSIVAKNIKALADNKCKVVAEDKYTDADWKTLNQSNTTSNIALGLSVNNQTKWFNAEGTTDTDIALGNISPSGGTLTTKLNSKYGHDWGNNETLSLNYSMTLYIEAV